MNSFFNQLTPAQAERLDMLAEEAAEVIVAVSKIKRHGWESHNPDNPTAGNNRHQLEGEMTDLIAVWRAMWAQDEITDCSLDATDHAWAKKLRYSHHQDNPA